MKKLLLITNRLVIGGPSRHVAMLAKGLEDKYEVLVVGGTAASGEVLALDLFDNLKSKPILVEDLSRKISLSRDYKTYKKLRKIIRDFQPDIVHTHTSKVGVFGRMAAKKEGVSKIFHTYHGLIFKNYFSGIFNQGLIKLDRYLASFTNRIIVLSQSQKADISSDYQIANKDKISVIPLALDLSLDASSTKFIEKYKIAEDAICIGIIGRLVEIKNIELFIDGIKHLKNNTNQNIRAFIVGDGPEKQNLMNYAKSLDLSDENLTFTSWCSYLESMYARLDIVALTSFSEGTPMSLMEAQTAAKAVIASDVGGVSDIVVESTGILFDIERPQEFFDGLRKMVEHKDMRLQLGNSAKEHAHENYSISSMISKIKQVYNS